MIVKKDPSTIQSYLEDSSNLGGGYAEKIAFPESYDELSSFLKESNSKKQPVTISGGGTGTSGGRIPFGGVVISTEKLNRIKSVVKNNSGGFIDCQAGVLIKDVKSYAEKSGLSYAYDPTEQTASIGGTIATNASGARSFKYGSTRQSVYALTLGLADGSIFKLRRGEIKAKGSLLRFDVKGNEYIIKVPSYKMPETKNAAGYYAKKNMDLIDLFIGQEGTLACILEAVLKLNNKPDGILSCFAFFDSEENAWNFSQEAKKLTDAMSIEYFDSNCIKILRHKDANVPDKAGACIFFEQEMSKVTEDKIIGEWEKLLSKYKVPSDDTWVAFNQKERQELLDKRHDIPEAMNEMVKKGSFPKVSTDLAVPDMNFIKMMNYYKKILKNTNIQHFLFGHIGDSHIHLNLLPITEMEYATSKQIALRFIKKSVSLGGTVSAEHGIGKLRRGYLKILYGEKGIEEMFQIKKILDPNLILGRGNVFS